jgi:hypothetical protein
MTLARHDISTVQKLRQIAQQEGLYEDPISKKSDYCPKLNTNSLNLNTNTNTNKNKNSHINQQFATPFNPLINPTQIQNPNVNNQTPHKQAFQSRQQQFDQNRPLFNKLRADLIRDRQNGTRNYYQSPQQPRVPNKRFREGSGQSRMETDESHHHYVLDYNNIADQDNNNDEQFHDDQLQDTQNETYTNQQIQQAENFPIPAWEPTNT